MLLRSVGCVFMADQRQVIKGYKPHALAVSLCFCCARFYGAAHGQHSFSRVLPGA